MTENPNPHAAIDEYVLDPAGYTARLSALGERRQAAAEALAAEVTATDLTVESVTKVAKAATVQTPLVVTEIVPGRFRIAMKYEDRGNHADALRRSMVAAFLQLGYDAAHGGRTVVVVDSPRVEREDRR